MKFPLAMLAFLAFSAPAPALAYQLLENRIDGAGRLCVYQGARGYYTGSDQQQRVRIGLSQECPTTPPREIPTIPQPSAGGGNIPPPATAMLEAEYDSAESRFCSYAERGQRWVFRLQMSQRCPLALGMLPTDAQ
jgi:hypothetical protein